MDVAEHAPPSEPDVFRYLDYRAYLRDYYGARKGSRYGFSLRAFSRHAGLTSSNYLKLVMDGDRNLTADMATRFATTCGLLGKAADYFCDLVAFNQARSTRERSQAHERLARFKRYREVHWFDAAQTAYYAHWYVPAIRELAARDDFCDDPAWIAQTLVPAITPREAAKAVALLTDLGMLVRAEGGRLVQAAERVTTGGGPQSHHVAAFHRAMINLGAQSIDSVSRDERDISSLTLCVDDTAFAHIVQRIAEVRAELLQRFGACEGRGRVTQVNFQVFPLSKP